VKTIYGTNGRSRLPLPVPFFYGWIVVALAFLTSLNGAGNLSALSVLIHPLEQEFGWSRASIAAAAAINLILLGVAAPITGWLVDRYGARIVMIAALTLLIAGAGTTTLVEEPWQLLFHTIPTNHQPPLDTSNQMREAFVNLPGWFLPQGRYQGKKNARLLFCPSEQSATCGSPIRGPSSVP